MPSRLDFCSQNASWMRHFEKKPSPSIFEWVVVLFVYRYPSLAKPFWGCPCKTTHRIRWSMDGQSCLETNAILRSLSHSACTALPISAWHQCVPQLVQRLGPPVERLEKGYQLFFCSLVRVEKPSSQQNNLSSSLLAIKSNLHLSHPITHLRLYR